MLINQLTDGRRLDRPTSKLGAHGLVVPQAVDEVNRALRQRRTHRRQSVVVSASVDTANRQTGSLSGSRLSSTATSTVTLTTAAAAAAAPAGGVSAPWTRASCRGSRASLPQAAPSASPACPACADQQERCLDQLVELALLLMWMDSNNAPIAALAAVDVRTCCRLAHGRHAGRKQRQHQHQQSQHRQPRPPTMPATSTSTTLHRRHLLLQPAVGFAMRLSATTHSAEAPSAPSNKGTQRSPTHSSTDENESVRIHKSHHQNPSQRPPSLRQHG